MRRGARGAWGVWGERRLRPLVVGLVGLAVGAAPLRAQDPAAPMQLNREGRWAEAAEVATRMLAAADALDPAQRCEVRSQLIYALDLTGRDAEAAAGVEVFDEECAGLAPDHWARREVERLRAGLRAPVPSVAADDWPVSDRAEAGLDAEVLAEHQRLCERSGADACVIVYRGALVQEWYGPGYREPMGAMSSTKSVTGLLAGMLIGDGRLELDTPVGELIPEWEAGAQAGVTVRHLLSMTSGLPDPVPDGEQVGTVTDKEAHVFGLPVAARPGERWAYSNDGAFLLSPLLDRAAGEPIEAYAERRLFAPLGMRRTRFHVYPQGQAWTHAELKTTPRDLARIGQLMLDGGRWRGEPIVPEKWIRASTRPSQSLNPDYGLLWWLDVPEGFAARGYLDTNIYVLPRRDLVVVRMQRRGAPDATTYEAAAFRLFRRLVR